MTHVSLYAQGVERTTVCKGVVGPHPMLASAADRCLFFSRSSSSFAMRLRWLLLMFAYGCTTAGCAGCSASTPPKTRSV